MCAVPKGWPTHWVTVPLAVQEAWESTRLWEAVPVDVEVHLAGRRLYDLDALILYPLLVERVGTHLRALMEAVDDAEYTALRQEREHLRTLVEWLHPLWLALSLP